MFLISSRSYPVDFMKHFCFLESRLPLCRHQHSFQKGDSILTLISFINEESRTAQREPSLLSVVIDPHDIRLQHTLMLRWVLLCLLELFYTSRRPLNFLGHQCLRFIDTSYSRPCLCLEYVHHQNFHPLLSNRPGGRCNYLHQHTTSVTVIHF
jgi:hypothetical protein